MTKTETITFHPLRNGVAWTVEVDGRTIGTVRREHVAFEGYSAHTPETRIIKVGRRKLETAALLAEDGFMNEFDTKECAAEALRAATVSR